MGLSVNDLAEKANFGAVVEYRRLLDGSIGRFQLPGMREVDKQLIELSMPDNLHTARYKHAGCLVS